MGIVSWLTRAAASLDLGCSSPSVSACPPPPSHVPDFRGAAAGRGLLESLELGSVVADTLTTPPRHSCSWVFITRSHHGEKEGVYDPGEEEEAQDSVEEEGCRGAQEGAGEEGR